MGCGYFTQVPDLIWVLVPVLSRIWSAAKAVALTDRATRAATATMTDFFMVILLLCSVLLVEVTLWVENYFTQVPDLI
jgi:hypothetical protein